VSVRKTSIDVYNKITTEGLLSKKRMQVYEILYTGEAMTGSEVAQKYKSMYDSSRHSESIRNRITELVKQGVVYEVGTVECPITGNTVLQFATTNSLPSKLEKPKTKRERKEEILTSIQALGAKIDDKWKEDLREIYRAVRDV
jgi:hypothetical protein